MIDWGRKYKPRYHQFRYRVWLWISASPYNIKRPLVSQLQYDWQSPVQKVPTLRKNKGEWVNENFLGNDLVCSRLVGIRNISLLSRTQSVISCRSLCWSNSGVTNNLGWLAGVGAPHERVTRNLTTMSFMGSVFRSEGLSLGTPGFFDKV